MPFKIVAPEGHGMQTMLPAVGLKALDPHGLHPTKPLVASPPYPAEHSQRPVSEFISALPPHAQESELVALVKPPPMDDPEGQKVHCAFPTEPLKALEPHALHPILMFVASPPYPALHSQMWDSTLCEERIGHEQSSGSVALVTPSEMPAPIAHCMHCVLPTFSL